MVQATLAVHVVLGHVLTALLATHDLPAPTQARDRRSKSGVGDADRDARGARSAACRIAELRRHHISAERRCDSVHMLEALVNATLAISNRQAAVLNDPGAKT